MMGPLIIEHVRELVENTVEIIWLPGLFNFYLVLQQIYLNTHIACKKASFFLRRVGQARLTLTIC